MKQTTRSYLLINLIFGGIVVAILIYSAVFSPETNNYPVKCVHEELTGLQCPSCGLSHSFSYIMRADFESAQQWNSYGIRVFLFFILQLVLRISISVSLIRRGGHKSSLVWGDAAISILAFVLGFSQFIAYYVRIVF